MSSWKATLRHSWLNRVKGFNGRNIGWCPACHRAYPVPCTEAPTPCQHDCKLLADASNFYVAKKRYKDAVLILAQFCLEMYWKRGGKLYR